MSRGLVIKIESKILEYVRKYSGFSLEHVSSKVKISPELLKEYEENGGEISISKLEKLSNIYKRPLSAFLLDKIPDEKILPKDFRVIYESNEKNLSPEVLLSVRRGRYVQSFLSELSDNIFEYKFPNVSLSSNIDNLAEWFRIFIGIKYSHQKKWQSSREVLNGFRVALESKKIFILQNKLGDDVSGFCLADKLPYLITLNSSDTYTRRIFTMFHEVAHLLLHKSGICSPDEFGTKNDSYIKIEKFCNQFAASFVLPADQFLLNNNVNNLLSIKFSEWSDKQILDIANSFKLSRDVILRRFFHLGFITENQYNMRRMDWERNPIKQKKKSGPIKIPQHILSVSQNGRGITSFVLNNMYSNKISFSAAAEFLDIKQKHIAKLEANI